MAIDNHFIEARRQEWNESAKRKNEILRRYATLMPDDDVEGKTGLGNKLEAALAILQRYNLAWSRGHLSYPETIPDYIKSASNPRAEEVIQRALQLPALYRLNFIKQLSFCCYVRKLDASHHRLPHALGTAEVAAMLMEAVKRRLPTSGIEREDWSDQEFTAVILWALLHDCYHGPMGHALEPLTNLLTDQSMLRLDKHFLANALRDHEEAFKLTAAIVDETLRGGAQDEFGAGADEAQEIRDLLKFFANPNQDSGRKNLKHYLLDIIDSSQIDADRIDYLLRDGMHLGEPILDKNRWFDVLMHARVVDVVRTAKDQTTQVTQRRLAFPTRYKNRIQEFLSIRHRFYREYYEHPERVAADDMCCHIIYYYLEKLGLWHGDREQKNSITREFMKLTDENLFSFLIELERVLPWEDVWYPREMIGDLLTNRHHRPVSPSFGVTVESWKNFLEEFKRMRARIEETKNELLNGVGKETGSSHEEETRFYHEAVKKVFQESDNDDLLIYFYAWFNGGEFKSKISLERQLWNRMLSDEGTGVEAYCKSSVYPPYYGDLDKEKWDAFKEFSQVHICIPKITADEKEGISMQRGEPPDPMEKCRILLYYPKLTSEGEERVEWTFPTISYPAAEFRPFQLFLTVQFDLAKCPNINEIVRENFLELLRACDWLDPED